MANEREESTMADFALYSYQREVVERPVMRENIIIWLPTGAGKTRAAVYVAKNHLETTPQAKVVLLVNKVYLVEQHYNKEFKPLLGNRYTLVPVSGESDEKDFFGHVLKDSHLVICTAQILENALTNPEEGKHVNLADITLLIIDECHHTQKENVYNKIMRRYMEKKLKGERKLPQILGLTASPGTGGTKTLDTAVEHVLEVCANLDSAIVSAEMHAPELASKVPRPIMRFDIAERRPKDPFGSHLKSMMLQIHEFMASTSDFVLRKIGTQDYEADVVMLEERGLRENNRLLAQCALHLRQYNNALLINDTLRMMDAFNSLENFYKTKKYTVIDGTDLYLGSLFQEHQAELGKLVRDVRFENPKMDRLQRTLLQQFETGASSRVIVFSKTRVSTRCLHDWVCSTPALQKVNIKAAILTGAGNGSDCMTQNQQRDTIRNFRNGTLNLLISTSVAEEGLDIPECNMVVRYGLLTNEIAQQQASGRARADKSVYSVVAQEGSQEVRRELTNKYLEDLTAEAIRKIQEMRPQAFRKKIAELQEQSIISLNLADKQKTQKRSCNSAANVQLLCRNCLKPVALGSDIKLVDNMHYVNVNPDFEKYYKTGGQFNLPRRFEDWEPGRVISCSNGNCNRQWGYEMKYKEVALLPNLAIKSFAFETPGGTITVKKWKNVPFTVDDFIFKRYYDERYKDLFN